MSRRSFSEGGPRVHDVYVLESENDPARHYVGATNDSARRLQEHNAGKSTHTKKYKPWKLSVIIGFADQLKASRFETYLKSGSGRAFSKRHF